MHHAPHRLPRTRLPIALAALALLAAASVGCAHDFTLENRESPVRVWLTIPEFAEAGGTIQALIYVGAEKVVEGEVRFPPGVPTVAFPTVYVTAGRKTVSVVLEGGRISSTSTVGVEGDTWVQVVLRDRNVTVRASEREPR